MQEHDSEYIERTAQRIARGGHDIHDNGWQPSHLINERPAQRVSVRPQSLAVTKACRQG